VFDKTTLRDLYINNFNIFAGAVFSFYTDNTYQNPVSGTNLIPGTYYVIATHPDCVYDSSFFVIQVKNKDFDIQWQSAQNLGKGYYTFYAPQYEGASYAWSVWGGSIVSGSNTTNQITVYYSENASKYVTVSCQINFTAGRTTANGMGSAVYLGSTGQNGEMEVMTPQTVTGVEQPLNNTVSVAYPNPAENGFAVSGTGEFQLTVFNAMGQLVYENQAYIANSSIDLAGKGLHVIHLNQRNRSQTLKVVLK